MFLKTERGFFAARYVEIICIYIYIYLSIYIYIFIYLFIYIFLFFEIRGFRCPSWSVQF